MAQTIEENKAIVRRWVHEVFNLHQLDSVGQLKVSEYIDWNPYPGQQTALAGFKSILESFFEAFPDFHYDVDEELGEGDIIVCIGTWSGTHTGHLMGMPPSGKRMSAKRIDIVRISDKMTERWGTGNELKMMELFGYGGPPQPSADSQDNKLQVRRFIEEVFNQRNLIAIERLVDDDAVQHPQATLAMFITFAAFPDGQLRIDNMVAEGDKVTAFLTFSGTHQGEFMGCPPSGRHVTTKAVLTLRLAGGRIIESRYELDLRDLARQIENPGQSIPVRGQAATIPATNGSAASLSASKAIVLRFMDEVVNQKNVGAAEQLLAGAAKDHFKESLTALLMIAAFPDARANVERVIEEGDRVTVVSTMTGTLKGSFLGKPATGQGVLVRRIDVFTVAEGKIVDVLHNFDLVGLMNQIGTFPTHAVYSA
jgi:predicted ester cyclase